MGRKSPSPGIREGSCSPVRFYASGDQVAGTQFRHRGWWHPADLIGQGTGPVLRVGPAKALLAHGSSPGLPGLRLVHRPGARRAGYAGPLKPTVATRRLNYSLVGLERLRTAGHHAQINQRYRTARSLELDQATERPTLSARGIVRVIEGTDRPVMREHARYRRRRCWKPMPAEGGPRRPALARARGPGRCAGVRDRRLRCCGVAVGDRARGGWPWPLGGRHYAVIASRRRRAFGRRSHWGYQD